MRKGLFILILLVAHQVAQAKDFWFQPEQSYTVSWHKYDSTGARHYEDGILFEIHSLEKPFRPLTDKLVETDKYYHDMGSAEDGIGHYIIAKRPGNPDVYGPPSDTVWVFLDNETDILFPADLDLQGMLDHGVFTGIGRADGDAYILKGHDGTRISKILFRVTLARAGTVKLNANYETRGDGYGSGYFKFYCGSHELFLNHSEIEIDLDVGTHSFIFSAEGLAVWLYSVSWDWDTPPMPLKKPVIMITPTDEFNPTEYE